MKKKFLALLMAAALCVGMLPSTLLADVAESAEDATAEEVTAEEVTAEEVTAEDAATEDVMTTSETSKEEEDVALSEEEANTPSEEDIALPEEEDTALSAEEEQTDEDNEIMLLSDPNLSVVSALAITSFTDGTEPFDTTEETGNDTSEDNGIVRSFDNIKYNLGFTTALKDSATGSVEDGYMMVEFTLPVDPSVAEFDMSTLNWCLDPVITYYFEDETTSTTWNNTSKPVEKQVLTGKRYISSLEGDAIPGSGSLTAGIYVKAAPNETVIQPTFTVYMEGNDASEAKTIEPDAVTVTAAPRYNIRLYRNTLCDALGYFDLDSGTMAYSKQSEDDVYGRIEGYGIAVQLYNDSADKGLKGVELPTGEITFTVTLKTWESMEDMTETPGWHPLLWDYEEATAESATKKGHLNRTMAAFGVSRASYAYLTPGNKAGDTTRYCYDGGNWSITQNSDYSLSVTLDGSYLFDEENFVFPEYGLGDTTTTPRFGANVGSFSAGYIQVIAAFPEDASESGTQNLDFDVAVDKMSITSVSGENTEEDMNYSDNTSHTTLTTYPSGSISKWNWYRQANSSSSALDNDGSSQTGSCYGYQGEAIRLASEIKYTGDTPLSAYNILQKFDDEALEVVPYGTTGYHHYTNVNENSTYDSVTVLYAAKPDGTGWASDAEMLAAHEEDLIYFTSLDTLKNAGLTCVGLLYEVRGTFYAMPGTGNYIYMDMNILDTAEVNSVYQTVNTARAWQQGFAEATSWTTIPYDSINGAYGWGYGGGWKTSVGYHEGYNAPAFTASHENDYVKSSYTNGVRSGHTNANQAGDSLLIIGDKTTVSIAVADTTTESSGQETTKTVYDLDQGERTVTYEVSPQISAAAANSEVESSEDTDNVTVTVTLPKGLSYDMGSAEVDPQSVIVNDDGTTTIVWYYADVKVAADSLKSFKFTCTIGAAGTADDVEDGDTLTIKAEITSDKDSRESKDKFGNVSETTISVIQLASSAISKSVEHVYSELGDDVTFHLRYGNTSDASQIDDELLDILPYSGDGRGSDFTGTYKVSKVTVDMSQADETWKKDQADPYDHTVHIEYTTDDTIRDYSEEELEALIKNNVEDEDLSDLGFKIMTEGTGIVDGTNQTVTWDFSDQDITGVTALYIRLDDIFPNEYVTVSVTLTTSGDNGLLKDKEGNTQQPGNVYANDFYQYYLNEAGVVTSNVARCTVVVREIRGLVWIDENRNGAREDGEELFEGATVTLYRTTPSQFNPDDPGDTSHGLGSLFTAYDVLGNEVEPVKTGADGAYAFTLLEAGTYYVVITGSDGTPISEYGLTKKDAAADTVDSDATANVMAGTLENGYIELTLPTTEEMTSAQYISDNNDAGLVLAPMEIVKVDGSTDEPLAGAVFTLTDSEGNYLLFEDGVYTGTQTATAGEVPAAAKLTSDSEGKISVSGLEVGLKATLTEIEVPEGYVLDGSDTWNIEVKIDEQTDSWLSYVYVDGEKLEDDNPLEVANWPTTTIKGEKIWEDHADNDHERPDSITVLILNGTTIVDTIEVTPDADGNWTWESQELPQYENGVEINYRIVEEPVSDYTTDYTQNDDGTWTITNTHTNNKTGVTVYKDWADNDNQDGKRAESITVNLLADGSQAYDEEGKELSAVLSEANNWTYTFTDLDINKDGEPIEYTIEENVSVDEYTTRITRVGDTNVFVIVNEYHPKTTDIEVQKFWDDNDDQDGIRPKSIEVTMTGTYTDDDGDPAEIESITKELSADTDWTAEFFELPIYAHHGNKIDYKISEVSVEGYETEPAELVEQTDGTYRIKITNTHTPETTEISVTKKWDDEDNQDGIRPQSVVVYILADGERVEDGYGNDEALVLEESNNWAGAFTDLPKNKAVTDDDGNTTLQEITYTIEEGAVEGYTTDVGELQPVPDENGCYTVEITNSHVPETTSIEGTKIWEDNDNQDGIRPTEIMVTLYADGEYLASRMVITGEENIFTLRAPLFLDTDTNTWNWSFTDLPKYKDGEEITYTFTENPVEGYETSYSVDGLTITNTHEPETVDIAGEKVWDDADDQDGVRPDYIIVHLFADDEEIASETITEEDNWEFAFNDLPKYAGGEEIEYTVEETLPSSVSEGTYTSDITTDEDTGDITITNTHEPETIDISGTKTWDDNDNHDGYRPDSITINLLADGTPVLDEEGNPVTAVVTEAENWAWSFTGLDKYRDGGVEIVYTITENAIAHYEPTITKDDDGSYTVTNTHTPDLTSLTVTKAWDDADNQDGKRPASITVQLYADGVAVEGKTAVLNADNNWTYTFTGLDMHQYGNETAIVYTVQEEEVGNGYTGNTTGDATTGYVITNSYTPETIEIPVTKVWNDGNNQDGKRPESITFRVWNGSTIVDSAEVKPDGNGTWPTYTFTELPKYENGKEIEYIVTEDPVSDYSTAITGNTEEGFTVTNAYTPGETSLNVLKVWDDNDDQDAARPDEVTVELLADGTPALDEKDAPITATLNEDNGWEFTFEKLPEYASGKKIEYTVDEPAVENYESVITGDATVGFVITNTHKPETVDITGEKAWDDAGDQDGVRPDYIIVHLFADDVEIASETITKEDNWKFAFTGLPKYADGKEIEYTVEETLPSSVSEGTYTSDITTDEDTGDITITNTHEPETIDISGTKTWDDNDNQDGARPAYIVVNLLANGEQALDKDGEKIPSAVVRADDDWKYSFSDLPKYKDGVEITYTVSEEAVTDYTTTYDGFDIKNTHTPGKTGVTVTKIWVDNDDQDGKRPESIEVQLIKTVGDSEGEVIDTATLHKFNDWTYTFADLDVYEDGTEIVYTVEEVLSEADGENYNHVIYPEEPSDNYTIVNSHQPGTIDIPVEKIWDDNNNQDGERADHIYITLYADGVEKESTTLSDDNEWKDTFEGLDKYVDGHEISYTITEVAVDDYTTEITGSAAEGFTITNTHAPGKTSVPVTKAWDDANDQDGIRPGSVTVNLLADGEAALDENGEAITTELSDENGWTYTFTDLDKKADGKAIEYTVEEVLDEDSAYTGEITGDAENGYIITNSHTPGTTEITGSKTWVDNDNQDGTRPESITIRLWADDTTLVGTQEVTPDENGDWIWTFTDLPKYRDGGVEIEYNVTEDIVPNYDTEYSETGYDVTNTHITDTVDIEGTKTWNDADNQDGKRPTEITIHLYADGEEIDSVTVSAGGEDDDSIQMPSAPLFLAADTNVWSWSFTDLPKYDNGKEITYTVTEDAVEGYETTINGYDVTNSHTPETVDIEGEKVWEDNNDQDGLRPDYITIHLLADDKEITSVHVTEEEAWSWSFTDLPKYANGEAIEYTVEETLPSTVSEGAYTSETTTDSDTGYITITNTHEPETIDIEGSKTWEDNDDQDDVRPESITIRLLADGEAVDNATVTADDDWSWTFTGLPKYKDGGTEISYTITEDAIDHYATEYSGYDVTNTHTPDQTSLTVTKAWDDSDNQDGIRPESVTVSLLADDVDTGKTVELSESNNWTGTFTELDIYHDHGEAISYTVAEPDVPDGYEVSIIGDAATGYTVINTHTPETVDIEGTKTWVDNDDQDGFRPEAITIRLLADGEAVDNATVTADDDWNWTFTGLPKYKDGSTEIVYTITEDAIDHYATEYSGYDVTNTHTPDQTSLTVTKAWDDSGDQDGIRPENVTVALLADGDETGKTVELNESNNWTGTFTELDIYHDHGEAISYTVAEPDVPDGYEVAITGDATTGYTVTNSHTPETMEITGSKTWVDNDDQDGTRPESITIRLWADDTTLVGTQEVTPDENGDWTWTFTDLPKYEVVDGKGGVEIKYNVTEDIVPNYDTEYSETGYDVTNTHATDTVDIEGTKTWDDADNQDGKRPTEITIHLFADGEEVDSITVTAGGEDDGSIQMPSAPLFLDTDTNTWSWSFTDLPKYKDGVEITYTITEDAVEGYETTIRGYDVTNSHTPETVDIEGSKTWDDADDQDGIRPDVITVHLYADGEEIDHRNVMAYEDWSWSFTGLDKYKNGEEISYTITEDAVDGYDTSLDGYDITNTHTPETIEITGTKTWDDAENQDGIRPESITVRLLADGTEVDQATVTEEDNWNWSFEDLPKYRDGGTEIVYNVTEDAVEGYATNYTSETDDEGNMTFTFTNSYTPEQTSVTVTKVWDDQDDQDGIRPADITVKLMANGEDTGKTLVLDESNSWQGSFTELDVNTPVGHPIEYTVEEVSVEGYDEADITGDAETGYVITNTHESETIDIPVEKVWEDEDGTYNHRPDAVEVELLADNEETGDTITLSDSNDWTDTFTGLAKYRDGGVEIDYTVKEITPEALQYYTPKTTYNEDGSVMIVNQRAYFDIDEEIVPDENERDTWVKNEAVNEYNAIELEMSTYLPIIEADELANGEFTMNFHDQLDSELVLDEADADFSVYIGGKQISHDYYVVTLGSSSAEPTKALSLGEPITDGCSFHVDVDLTALYLDGVITEDDLLGDTEIMIFFYADLEGTDLNGTYKSTVWYEVYDGDNLEYTSSVDVVYVYTYEIYIKKYDAETDETLAGATLGVYYDPECIEPVSRNGEPYTVVSGEEGAAIFYGLADGTYYVTELGAPEGYELSNEVLEVVLNEELNDNNYMYVGEYANTPEEVPEPTPETVDVNGSKTWEDDDDADGKRPENITINLLADGTAVDTVTVTESDEWAWSFTELDKYDADGKEITYSITEEPVTDYDTTYPDDSYDVTNTYAPEGSRHGPEPETVDVNGSKTWEDDDDADGKRPESITIHLLADDEEYDSATVTADDNWAWSFTDLPKYQSDGTTEVAYTITEDAVENYTTEVNGYDVTNTYETPEPETVEVNGSKTWEDNDNQDGKRPESITINLLANGETSKTETVTADDHWAWSFTDLAKYDEDGDEITYSITEDEVENYTTEVNGYDVTNTYVSEETASDKVSVSVTKVWDDENDVDGIRPDRVVIDLYKNGEPTGQVLALDEDNDWTASFYNLDEYTEGVKNVYTVQEQDVEGYTAEITGDAEAGFVVTNTHTHKDTTSGENPPTSHNGNDGNNGSNPTGTTSGTSGTGSTGGTSGTGSTGGTSSAGNAKTSDADLPILPIAGCCVAIALIAGILVFRRKRES